MGKSYLNKSEKKISKEIAQEVINIWKFGVSYTMPILIKTSIIRKVNRLWFERARAINRKHLILLQNKYKRLCQY